MIRFNINQSTINKAIKELDNKQLGLKVLPTPSNKEYYSKALFTIASNSFIRDTNLKAGLNPKKFHHVYEWGSVGNKDKRLFTIIRSSVRGGNLVISSRFLDSKVPVPVAAKLGKKYTGSHVFKKKASVMEAGRPIVIIPKRGKFLVFPNKNGELIFTKRSYVRNPGGKYVKGAFDSHMKSWFSNPSNINSALTSSGFVKELENGVAKVLNKNGAGATEVNAVIRTISTKYSQGRTQL